MLAKLVIFFMFIMPNLANGQSKINKDKFYNNREFEDKFGYVQAIQVDKTLYDQVSRLKVR